MKRNEKLFLIISVTFVIPGGGTGTFYLETQRHFTRSGIGPARKFHFSASLFKIFGKTGMGARNLPIGCPNQISRFDKAQDSIERRALLKEDVQMRVSFKKCWMDMPPVEIVHCYENFI